MKSIHRFNGRTLFYAYSGFLTELFTWK